MSISADPIFVQAEVAYRREALTAAAGHATGTPRHHAGRIRQALRGVRVHHRHARPAARTA